MKEFGKINKKLKKYIIKKAKLIELANNNKDYELLNILDNLSMTESNILWDYIDAGLSDALLMQEIKIAFLNNAE